MRRGKHRAARQGGFTYFAVIIAVLMIGIALAVVGTVARTEAQREHERQLLFVGHAFRDAILHYYRANGGRFPQSLQDLLQDESAPKPVHHLRKLYPDPITGGREWMLMRVPDGGIYGLYSASTAVPRKRKNFDPQDIGFEDAACYQAWRFAYAPRTRAFLVVPPVDDCPQS